MQGWWGEDEEWMVVNDIETCRLSSAAFPSLGRVSIQGQSVYLGHLPSALATRLDTKSVLSAIVTLHINKEPMFTVKKQNLGTACWNTVIIQDVGWKFKNFWLPVVVHDSRFKSAWLCAKLEITKLCDERFMGNMMKAILSHCDHRGEQKDL